MTDVRRLSVRVDGLGPRVPTAVFASDLIPPAEFEGESTTSMPLRFDTLRLCTEVTYQEFASCPAADLWELVALQVSLDPDSFCSRVRNHRMVAVMDFITRCRAMPADDVPPRVRLFLSNLARAERALLEGVLQPVPDTDSNRPAALWAVTAGAYATWAREVRLPRPSTEAYYVSPLLAIAIAAAAKFYRYKWAGGTYVPGVRSTEPNGKAMVAWIAERTVEYWTSARLPVAMFTMIKDQRIAWGVTPAKKK